MRFTVWPDTGHLPGVIAIACVAALAVGLGSLAGARRTHEALIVGWGVTGLATVVVGTLTGTSLRWVLLAASILGAIGLVRVAISAAFGRPVLAFAMTARILLLCVPLLILIESIEPASWDDFSHWLPNSLYLATHDHFPNLLQPNDASSHPAYPYGDALPAYAVSLLGPGWLDTAGIYWNLLVLLAACTSIADLIGERCGARLAASPGRDRNALWASAALGLLFGGLLCPTFTPKFALSNMAEGATSAVMAVMGKLALDALRAEGPEGRPAGGRRSGSWDLAWCGVALVNLRQTNAVLLVLLFAGLAAGVLLCHRRLTSADATAMGRPLATSALLFGLWNGYALAQIPGGQFSFLPAAAWRWSTLGLTLASIAHVVLVKFGFFCLLAGLGLWSYAALKRSDSRTDSTGLLPIAVLILSLGNMAFLAFTYLAADFSADEAAKAASFWRYCEQTGLAVVLALAAVVPLRWLDLSNARPATTVLCVGAALAPLAVPNFVRYDARSEAPFYRRIGDDIFEHWAPGTPVRLLDAGGNGYPALVTAFQIRRRALQAGRHAEDVMTVSTPDGLTRDDLAAVRDGVSGPQYAIWLADGDAETAAVFSQPLIPGCSYLLQSSDTGLRVTRSWSLEDLRARASPQRPGVSAAACRP